MLQRQIKRLENIVASIHTFDSDHILVDENEINQYFSEIKKSFDQIKFNIQFDFNENKCLLKNDFKQILDNLIDNSSKYGANEIDVLIKMNQSIEMEISDNGIGIPKKEKENIFDKYYRISRNENNHVNGLGVGLFLVKKNVDKYNGNIEVNTKNKGVSFKIIIPNEN